MPIDSPRPICTSCNDVNGAAGRCSGVQARAVRALNAGRQCRVSPRLYRRTGARSVAARLQPLRPCASQQRASSQIEPAQSADRYPAPPDEVRRAAQPWWARIACSSWSARRRQDTQNGRDDTLGAIRPTNCARTMEARALPARVRFDRHDLKTARTNLLNRRAVQRCRHRAFHYDRGAVLHVLKLAEPTVEAAASPRRRVRQIRPAALASERALACRV